MNFENITTYQDNAGNMKTKQVDMNLELRDDVI